jgi:hypothetical protein
MCSPAKKDGAGDGEDRDGADQDRSGARPAAREPQCQGSRTAREQDHAERHLGALFVLFDVLRAHSGEVLNGLFGRLAAQVGRHGRQCGEHEEAPGTAAKEVARPAPGRQSPARTDDREDDREVIEDEVGIRRLRHGRRHRVRYPEKRRFGRRPAAGHTMPYGLHEGNRGR